MSKKTPATTITRKSLELIFKYSASFVFPKSQYLAIPTEVANFLRYFIFLPSARLLSSLNRKQKANEDNKIITKLSLQS